MKYLKKLKNPANSGSSIFAVTIQPEIAYTTPPVITVPDDITITTSNPVIHTNSTVTSPGAIAWDGTGVSFEGGGNTLITSLIINNITNRFIRTPSLPMTWI